MIKKIFESIFHRKKHVNTDKLILVVDDGEIERKFMERTLKSRGYKVVVASNGEDGVQTAQKMKPDLIFLDYSLPGGINGQETCRQIKSEAYAKDIPIVFLSGSVSPTKVIDCYDMGAEYYLSKPIGAATLLEHTRLLLEDAEQIRKLTRERSQQS